jgi:hypothetical protein
LPDLLEPPYVDGAGARGRLAATSRWALGSAAQAAITGVQAFIFAGLARGVVGGHALSPAQRAQRIVVLGAGLTFFGVRTVEHVLRNAGYRDRRLLHLSLLGPFLNVPYRAWVSATLVHLAENLLRVI